MFIELTVKNQKTGEFVTYPINMSYVKAIQPKYEQLHEGLTGLWFGNDEAFLVKETSEEIMQLIKEAS